MPTEDELRRQLHDDRPHGSIDLDAVLRRARTRRRPRVAAVAIVSSLAAVGIVLPVSISVASSQTGGFSSGSAASAPDAALGPQLLGGSAVPGTGDSSKRAPAEKINLCGGPLATPVAADDGLVLTVEPVDAAASARDIPVTVTLTNTGEQQVTGSLSPFPTLTLSRDGVVLWHSNGAVPSLAQEIDLAPGAATTFSTTFEPLVCGVADDSMSGFRADLPQAGPGEYLLSAALDFSPATPDADGSAAAVLVTGPTSPVTLR